jgi:hypothetical protein
MILLSPVNIPSLRLKSNFELSRTYTASYLLSPLRGFLEGFTSYPRLAPWAAFFRRFAAGFGRLHGLDSPTTNSGFLVAALLGMTTL